MFIFSLFSKSGGLSYHLKAKNHKHLWLSHKEATALFLGKLPITDKLVLIGPSAGYSLPEEFLRKYKTLTCVDPDRAAPMLFRKNFPDLKSIRWDRENYFFKKGGINIDGLEKLAHKYRDQTFVFCNFLGQLPLLIKEQHPGWESNFRTSFSECFKSYNWASYHDIYSCSLKPKIQTWNRAKALQLKKYAHDLFINVTDQSLIHDHHSLQLIPESHEYSYWHWEITPGYWHIIEGTLHIK